MTITLTHAKTNNIADWTQATLDAQIALGNYPVGTVLADIVLPSDWNAGHGITMATGKVLGRATALTGAVEELSTTGTGNVVLATSPTLITPALGTPSALVGTNITGLMDTQIAMTDYSGGGAATVASATIHDMHTGVHSRGVFRHNGDGLVSANGTTAVDVAACRATLRATNDKTASLEYLQTAAVTNHDITALLGVGAVYIYIAYATGATIQYSNTDPDATDEDQRIIKLAEVHPNLALTAIDVIHDTREFVGNHPQEWSIFHKDVFGTLISGQAQSITGVRKLAIGSGTFHAHGYNNHTVAAFDTNVASTFIYMYYNGAAWVEVAAQTDIDNLQYNDIASGLVTLGASKWKKDWVFRGMNGTVYVLYGQAEYTNEQNAIDAALPTLPTKLTTDEHRFLMSSVTVQKSSATATLRDLANRFNATNASYTNDHGNLSGLLDNDHPQYALLTGAAFTGGVSTTSNFTSTVATGTAPLVVSSTTEVANLKAATATLATAASTTTIVDDTTTNATMYPTWVTTTTGNLPLKVSSTKISFNPSTGRETILGGITAGDTAGVTTPSTDATLDIFGTTNAIIHGHNVGAQSTTAGAAIIAYAVPAGAAMASGNRLGTFVAGGSNHTSNSLANATALSSFTTEAWTTSANGAKLQFEVTANGATSRQVALTLDNDKNATFGGSILSPTLVTPALGTPASGVLTNCTGLPVAGGGTGVATLTAYAPIFGGTTGTGAVQSGTVGTAGQVLTSNGAGALPTFQAAAGGNDNNSSYRHLLQAWAPVPAATAAGTWRLMQGDYVIASATGAGGTMNTIYIDPADYPTVGALTTKLRIRAQIYTNDVAPTGNFTLGLYPFTRPATSGGAGSNIFTLGTVITGSDGATVTTPTADGLYNLVGSDFAIPAAGHYTIGLVTTATVAANSHVHVHAELQMRNT